MIRPFLTGLCVVCVAVASRAQDAAPQGKVGHLSSGLVLESLPEVAAADTLLQGYQDTLRIQYANLETSLQTLVDSVRGAQDDMTPKAVQGAEQRAAALQQEMQVFQQEGARVFQERRERYLSPILARVQEAIVAYAKANGYQMILDSSIPGVLVFARDSDDLTEQIIGELRGGGAKP